MHADGVDVPVCFPVAGNVFPSSFDAVIRKVWRLLLHVLAHLYHAHFKHLLAFNLQAFINTVTFHFMLFGKRFSLLADAKDVDVLDDLFHKLNSVSARVIGKDDSRSSLSSSSSSSVAAARTGATDNTSQTSLSPTTHESLTSLATSPTSSSAPVAVSAHRLASGEGDALTSQRLSGSPRKSGSLSSTGSFTDSALPIPRRLANNGAAANAAVTSLSSSPVLTTQPNGHARRTPST